MKSVSRVTQQTSIFSNTFPSNSLLRETYIFIQFNILLFNFIIIFLILKLGN